MRGIKVIGNTPMIKINYEFKNKPKYIYAKLEYYNLTGSIKDRVAFYIINNAKKRGKLKENMPIIEATSGNTGISLAALGKKYKHKVYIFMPDWASKERINLMKEYGNDDDSINMTKKLANELGLGVGISSGANLIGSILLNEKIDKPVVTIFADDNKKYFSTDLFKEVRPKDEWISSKIKLIDYNII